MKVGIIAAMEEEIKDLLSHVENMETYKKGGCTYYSGTINGIDTVLLLSGIGKVSVAVGTTLLIDHYSPDIIINTGSAGGLDSRLNVGDIVISNEVRYNDVDVTIFDYEFGQIPQMPPCFTPDEKLSDTAEKAAEKIKDIAVHHGLVVTGDSFIHDPAKVEEMKSKLPPMLATEMEAAAIAQVCHMFKLPFIIIRAISDVPGKESKQSFEEFLKLAGKNSATMVLEILKEIKDK